MQNKVEKMVYISIISSMTFIIAKFTRFPIFPTAPFLKMELGEVPLILFTSFTSWEYGITALLIKEVLSFVLTGSNILALIADFVACGTWLLVFDITYKRNPLNKNFWFAVVVGGIARMVIAIPLNFIILPLQYGSNKAVIMSQLVYILPFNFIKSALDGVCFRVLCPKLNKPLKSSFLIFKEEI